MIIFGILNNLTPGSLFLRLLQPKTEHELTILKEKYQKTTMKTDWNATCSTVVRTGDENKGTLPHRVFLDLAQSLPKIVLKSCFLELLQFILQCMGCLFILNINNLFNVAKYSY